MNINTERRLAVADIHGCAKELESVLWQAKYNPNRDQLFLLGDYVDRGPEPARTVEIVRDLERNGTIVLLGNHEWATLRAQTEPDVRERLLLPRNGGAVTLADYGGRIPDDVLEWFRSLPLLHTEPDCILVHAGLRPGVSMSHQSVRDLLEIREPFFSEYSGKTVIFGHTPTNLLHGKLEPWYGKDKIGIDTGVCFKDTHGGCLTLFDLDTQRTWTA